MDRREAELIFEVGKDAVVEALLAMDARVSTLEEQILVLQKKRNCSTPTGVEQLPMH